MDLSGIDAESRALILELYIADLKAASDSGKGKSRADDAHSDFEAALEIQRDELANAVQVAADEYLARIVERDGEDPDDLTAANLAKDTWESHRRVEELGKALYGDRHEPATGSVGLSSMRSSTARRPSSSGTGPSRRTCTACNNEHHFLEMVPFPCSHSYCQGCTKKLCQASLDDDNLFPPRCCNQPITFSLIRRYLDRQALERYEAKRVKLGTPNHAYCYRPSCSSFVPPEGIANGVANCPKCPSRTCIICHSAAHVGRDCPSDEGVKQVLTLGRVQGWQRCFSCRQMVELTQGCNHMICTCRAEFCYVCGEKWKTCTCAQMQEEHLITRATRG